MSDLHRVLSFEFLKGSQSKIPVSIGTQFQVPSFPMVVSNTKGKFVDVNRAGRDGSVLAGVFVASELNLDYILPDLFKKAFEASKKNNLKNVFKNFDHAYSHIFESSGGLTPSFIVSKSFSFLKKNKNFDEMTGKFGKTDTILSDRMECSVVCSRPDFVGQLTSFNTSSHSIILHNLELGLAFF